MLDPHVSISARIQRERAILGFDIVDELDLGVNCQYGAGHVASRYCGFGKLRRYPGEWQHGWHPAEHNIHPEFVIGSTGLSRHERGYKKFLVARQDQAEFLTEHGYRHVEAIGLPIVYVEKPLIERLPGSLLVMPVHSLDDTTHNWDAEAYAEEIGACAGAYTKVVACVHRSCIEKGYWVSAFEKRGIPVVQGAFISDASSLDRMAQLFTRFEAMTTNGFGSHVPYAAYFGCRTSVHGELAELKRAAFERVMLYRNVPEILDDVLFMHGRDHLERTYAEFFCTPGEARQHIAWAARELGEPYRRTPADLRELFGWAQAPISARVKGQFSRALRKSMVHLRDRLHPQESLRRQEVQKLDRAVAGQKLEAALDGGLWRSGDGARLQLDRQAFLGTKVFYLMKNPVDAPVVDFCPGVGCSLVAMRKQGGDRTIFYVTDPSMEVDLDHNLVAFGVQNVHRLKGTENVTSGKTCSCSFVDHAQTLSPDIRDALLMSKIDLCASCSANALAQLRGLPSLQRFVVEANGDVGSYYPDLVSKLHDAGFRIDLDYNWVLRSSRAGDPPSLRLLKFDRMDTAGTTGN